MATTVLIHSSTVFDFPAMGNTMIENIRIEESQTMKLSEYFENAKGKGILATADISGKVNAAVYARPHFMDESTIAFIMAERLSHENLQSNPNACYIFVEDEARHEGKRLYLTKTKEDKNSELIKDLRRNQHHTDHNADSGENRYLVYFHIDRVLPIIGSRAG